MCRVLISTVFVAAIALTVIAPAMSIETGNRDTAQKETSNSTAQHRLVALEQKLVALTERIEQLEHALKQSRLDNDPKEVQFKIFSLVYADAESTTKAVEVSESLPDGTEFKAVWSYLPQSDVAKLVTVHFFD